MKLGTFFSGIGAVEKDVIFVIAYFIRDKVDHLESPASLSWTWNSTEVVLKPTHEDKALKKICFSGIDLRISTAFLSNNLKSEAFDISIFVAELIRE